MKKSNVIAVSIEIGIVIIILLLSFTPFFKKNSNLIDDIFKPLNQDTSPKVLDNGNLANNIVFIEFGINTLIDGEGAILKDNDINITKGGTYNLSGKLLNGSIHINTEEAVLLNLNDVNIISHKEVLVIDKAKEVTINVPEGSNNYLTDGINNSYPSAIYVNSPLIFTGTGKLFVKSLKASIISSQDYVIKEGKLIFLGQKSITNPKESEQNTLIFNLNIPIEPKEIELTTTENVSIIQENISGTINNIMISSPKISNESYYLYQTNSENTKEKIIIDSLDSYEITDKINLFGATS